MVEKPSLSVIFQLINHGFKVKFSSTFDEVIKGACDKINPSEKEGGGEGNSEM